MRRLKGGRVELRVPLEQWGRFVRMVILPRTPYFNMNEFVRIAPCREGCTFEDVMRQAGIGLVPVR